MLDERSKLLVATGNKGKLNELKALLADMPVDLLSLSDISCTIEVEETGSTFAENAALKAREYALIAGIPTWESKSGRSGVPVLSENICGSMMRRTKW